MTNKQIELKERGCEMSDYSGTLHLEELLKEQSPDAYQWSRAMQGNIFETQGVWVDQQHLHALVAGAMMAMHDHIHNSKVAQLKQRLEEAEKVIKQIGEIDWGTDHCDAKNMLADEYMSRRGE